VRNLTRVREVLLGMAKDRIAKDDQNMDIMGLLCKTEPFKTNNDAIVDVILAVLLAGSLT